MLRSPLDYVLAAGVAIGALGVAALGAWTLVTRRVPQPLHRLRGEVSGRPQPVRLGGFWLLLGTALLVMPMIRLLGISPRAGTMMFAAAGIALVAATVWYAVRRD